MNHFIKSQKPLKSNKKAATCAVYFQPVRQTFCRTGYHRILLSGCDVATSTGGISGTFARAFSARKGIEGHPQSRFGPSQHEGRHEQSDG